MADRERVEWLFPQGARRGAPLDPEAFDPDDCAELLAAEHGALDEELGDEARASAHLALHVVVARQILEDSPPEVWATAMRLSAAGYERHEIGHMLAAAFAVVLHDARAGRSEIDLAAYRSALAGLPGTWLAMQDGEDAEDEEGYGPSTQELLDSALALLAEGEAMSTAEVAARLEVPDARLEALEDDPAIVALGDGRLCSLAALAAGVTLTHVVTTGEAEAGKVLLDSDLEFLERWLDAGGGGLEAGLLIEPGDPPWLSGATGRLETLRAGELIGIRFGPGPATVVREPAPVIDEGLLVGALRARFAGDERPGDMPLALPELVCALLAEVPAARAGVLPPLSGLFERAGYEIRDGYAGPTGTDWEDFDRTRTLAAVAAAHDLEDRAFDRFVVLAAIAEGFTSGDLPAPPREVADRIGDLVASRAIVHAFADLCELEGLAGRAVLAAARKTASREERAVLWWAESVFAQRGGDAGMAEVALRRAFELDAELEPVIADLAWYASDRGQAERAVALLERIEEDDDAARIDLLRRYLPALTEPAGGRNALCPCGSGRKFKHCCLAAASRPQPLAARVAWLWEKLRWWLERSGRVGELSALAVTMLGGGRPRRIDETELLVMMDRAASLVLFADGAIDQFLAERGALLPDDEHNLLGQWALSGHSVYEVSDSRPGEGVTIRDIRTGDVLEVSERRGSTQLHRGDLVLAHPVFDGTGYQFVGGIQPLPLSARDAVIAALDEDADAEQLAEVIGGCFAPPTLANREGEPIVLCRARYAGADSQALAARLDELLEPAGGGRWDEWVEVDGQRWLRGGVIVDEGRVELFANSIERFERLRGRLAPCLEGWELRDEERLPQAALERRAAQGAQRPWAGPPPGAHDALQRLVGDAEERWVDESVPALGGLTPRQAADDPTRREELVALLHDFDRRPTPPGAVSFDTDRLRRRLGLVEPGA